jgi:hypothetical protein
MTGEYIPYQSQCNLDRNMVNVNKRQKEILTRLNKKFPNCLNYEILLVELGNKQEDIVLLDDLKSKGLVDMSCTSFVYPDGTMSHEAPNDSWITVNGRTKLRETFFNRLMLLFILIIGIEAAIIIGIFKLY